MKIDKLLITDNLRQNIVELRRKNGLSAYDLSEKSGHSKYWLPNIENGKTQKISKEDLISLYSVMLTNFTSDAIKQYIEQIIQQPLSTDTSWYNLQTTPKAKMPQCSPTHHYSLDQLNNIIDKNFSIIRTEFFKIISDQPTSNQEIALNALERFQRSFIFNPELSLALMNIPLYGVNADNKNEYTLCINDLTTLAAKYSDLANRAEIKQKICIQENLNRQLNEENRKTAQQLKITFYSLLSLLEEQLTNEQCSNLFTLLKLFYSSVVNSLKRLVASNLNNEVPDISEIKTGNNFCDLIEYCSALIMSLVDHYHLSLPSIANISTYDNVVKLLHEVSTIQ